MLNAPTSSSYRSVTPDIRHGREGRRNRLEERRSRDTMPIDPLNDANTNNASDSDGIRSSQVIEEKPFAASNENYLQELTPALIAAALVFLFRNKIRKWASE